jgi:2-polyprenyl-6-methoxyphenol hydroxylase-like FAD-dependent oxidoreductase
VLSRHDLTKVLYEGLSPEARAKVHSSKNITSVESLPEGMSVTCADGSTYTGDLVIAADGAHSMMRANMRRLALEAGATQEEVNAEEPFLTTYRCLWIRFPTASIPGLRPGIVGETHGPGASTQMFVGETTAVTGIYERLDKPRTNRVRYSQQDQDDMVKKWGFLPLVKDSDFTIAKAYASREQSGLVSLEEGVVEHWSWSSKIVLVGDSVHKMTPSTGGQYRPSIHPSIHPPRVSVY